MGQTEMLGVRAASENIQVLLSELPEKLRDFADVAGLRSVRVYRRRELDTDLLIQLDWDSELPQGKTRAGHILAEFLSQHGMVNHTTWDIVLKEDSKEEDRIAKGDTRR